MQIFILFAIWRLLDICIAALAPQLLPYGGVFSHPGILWAFNLPSYIRSFANFDGIFYLRIAQHGYSQFEQAFFPFYPFLIRFFAPIFGNNHLLTGLLISNGAFFGGIYLFSRYLSVILKPAQSNQIRQTLLLLLAFPTSFFFGSVYTEGVFFLLVTACFYALAQKKYTLAFLTALLASLTRLIGVFLIIPILLSDWRSRKSWFAGTGPMVGLGLYMAYLYRSTGDPLNFFHVQTAFGAGRSTNLIFFPQVIVRYIKIFLTVPPSYGLFVSTLEFSIFALFLSILTFQLYRSVRNKTLAKQGLTIFSLINLLLPTATGTLLSVPRFALLSLSVFIFFGELRSPILRMALILVFSLLHAMLLTYFIQGYFVS